MAAKELYKEGEVGSKQRWIVVVLCLLLYILNSYAMFVLGMSMNPVKEFLSIGSVEGGVLSSIMMFGAVLGCIFMGPVANRWGSRNMTAFTGIVIAVGTALCVAVANYTAWLVIRFIVGLAVGAMLGPIVKLVSDHWGPKRRNSAIAAALVGFSLGGFFTAFLGKMFLATDFRVMYGVALAFVIPAILLFILVPSDRLTAEEQKVVASGEANIGFSSIVQGNLKWVSLFAVLVSFCNMAGVWALGTWLPTWLTDVRGLSTDLMANFSMVNYTGGFFGYFFWSWLGTKIGNAKTLIIGYFGTAIFGAIYIMIPGQDIMFYLGFILYFCQAINVMCSITFGQAFPRLIRAYGAGTCFNLGRIGSIISPSTTALVGTAFGLTAGLAMVPVFYGVGGFLGIGLKRFVDIQLKLEEAEDALAAAEGNAAARPNESTQRE